MQVRLLGHISVGDSDTSLGGPTQRCLLAALALRRNEVVSVSHLIDAIWCDSEPPRRAEHNVRSYVHRLRTSIGDDGTAVETVGKGYILRLGDDELDTSVFETQAARASRSAAAGEFNNAIEAIDMAERIWKGRPLEEFENESWATPTVVGLIAVHSGLKVTRAEAMLGLGRSSAALPLLRSLVAERPLTEQPRALLMRALYESGRQVEALREFNQFRRLLVEETGTEPSSDLAELDQLIAAGQLENRAEATRSIEGYEFHERIGEGVFAIVHRATQLALGRDVAVKIIRAELANHPEFIRRFEAEAKMVARTEHPNVVPLYDFWREPDRAFLVMRWMSGGTLEARITGQPWPLPEVLDLMDQMAGALDAAHRAGLVHRDIKPANILFDDEDRAFLGDFGIALDSTDDTWPEPAWTSSSPLFSSPEQLRHEPLGPESDVHSLAMVAYSLLAGQVPPTDSPEAAAQQRQAIREPKASDSKNVVLNSVYNVLRTATAEDPQQRYPSATSFTVALRAASETKGAISGLLPSDGSRLNPYKGLRAFDESDTRIFFGREKLVAELLEEIRSSPEGLLAVVGPSGSGKSSVVRAGFLPALRDGGAPGSSHWFVTTMIPGAHPYEALETALLRVAVNPPATLLEQLKDGDRGVVRGIRRIFPDDDGVVVIVIDQFEELFTSELSETDRDQFLSALARAAQEPDSPVRFVITLRADFYDRPLRHPDFAPLLKRNTVVVTPLTVDELSQTIEAPAALVGVSLESGLVAKIMADVNHEPGALPLLQYALTRAFEQSTGTTIDKADYHDIGGITGALAGRAEELWGAGTDQEQAATLALFGRLVTLGLGTEDTRRRVNRSELGQDDVMGEVMDRFGNARLLTFDHNPSNHEATVEIAHEALIREWPRLREWIDESRDQLRVHHHLAAATAGWLSSGRDSDELLRGARLEAAEDVRRGTVVQLNPDEEAFIGASSAQREAEVVSERRRVSRLRSLVVATSVIAVMALLAGVVAFAQRSQATESARQSETSAELADQAAADSATNAELATASAELADLREGEAILARDASDVQRIQSQAEVLIVEDAALGNLLAAEAYRIDPSRATEGTLNRVLRAVPGLQASVPGAKGFLWLLDGGERAIIIGPESVERWNLQELRMEARLSDYRYATGVSVSEEAGLLAVVSEGKIRLIDIDSGEHVAEMEPAGNELRFSPDGTRLLAAGAGDLVLWDTSNPAIPSSEVVSDEDIQVAQWNQDGTAYVRVSMDGRVDYWGLGEGTARWSFTEQFGPLARNKTARMLFTGDGEEFILLQDIGQGGTQISLRSLQDGSVLGRPITTPSGLLDIDWIDEDRRTITVTNFIGLEAYDLLTGEPVPLPFAGDGTFAYEYSPSLNRLVEVGFNGIRIWHPSGSSPLERRIPMTSEQRGALGGAGWIYASLDGDGSRLITSVFTVPPLPVAAIDLTTPRATASSLDLNGVVTSAGDYYLLINRQAVVLDRDLNPMGEGIDTPVDLIWFELSSTGSHFGLLRRGGMLALYRSSGEFIANLDLPGPISTPGDASFSFSRDGLVIYAAYDEGNEWASFSTTDGHLIEPGDSDRMSNPWLDRGVLYGNPPGSNDVLRLDPATGEEVGTRLVGNSAPLARVADGGPQEIIATATLGQPIRVWDKSTGQQLGQEIVSPGTLISFTDDGRTLKTNHPSHTALWNYDTSTWVDVACRVAGRNMTRAEWAEFIPSTIPYRSTCPEFPIED